MPVPLEQFVKRLEESGILAAETLHDLIPPKAAPADAESLARDLVGKKHLTRFQAEQIWTGKGKSLVLGNYVLLEKLGQGGMGQVFKARHRLMQRIVALKVLAPALLKDPAAMTRFLREVQVSARLMHPNIVSAYDADESAGTHFLVMEYVEGSDLAEVVRKEGPLSIAKAVNYILQVARGLHAAHGHGIVHRDIKPANLLLDKKGTVKILDMGLARIEPAAGEDQAGLTATGAIMGTVDFMAPEQAVSTRSATACSDIYSLGCTLFYLLLGKATYGGDSLMAKLMAHRERAVPSLREQRPEVSEQLDAIFRKMVAKRVEDRYPSLAPVIADLEQLPLDGHSSLNLQPAMTSGSLPGGSLNLNQLQAVPLAPAPSNVIPPAPLSAPNIAVPAPSVAPSASSVANQPSRLIPPAARAAEVRLPDSRLRRPLRLVAAVVGVVALVGAYLLWQKINAGTLVVEVEQLGALVEVSNARKQVEFSRKIDKSPLAISLAPGKHRLTVEKAGLNYFSKNFELRPGGKQTITVELQPFGDPVVARKAKAKAFQGWIDNVAGMPAAEQTLQITEKLQELNPGYLGAPNVVALGNDLTELRIQSDVVVDVTPLQALTKLKVLTLFGDTPQNQFADLSPIRGLQLTAFHIGWSQVADLSPIANMPLTRLECHALKVSDLSPLKSLKLTAFECYSPQVSDLSPLAGMKLELLKFSGTQVSDLSPLRGMPLATLHCHSEQITDLSPLQGLPLKELNCFFVPSRDTAILRAIPTLERINGLPVAEFWKQFETK